MLDVLKHRKKEERKKHAKSSIGFMLIKIAHLKALTCFTKWKI
jgi:hypothetical protein